VADDRRPELSKAKVSERPEAELAHTVQAAAVLGHAPEPAALSGGRQRRPTLVRLADQGPADEKLKVVGVPPT